MIAGLVIVIGTLLFEIIACTLDLQALKKQYNENERELEKNGV